MDVAFVAPAFFWLLLALPLVWLGRGGSRFQALLRTLALVLLAAALARPIAALRADERIHVFVLDRSASVPAAEAERAARELASRLAAAGDGAETRVIELASAPCAPLIAGARVLACGTLSDALAAAERALPEHAGGAVTLLTDGEAEDERWREVLQRCTERGLPLNVAPLAARANDVYPFDLRSDGVLRAGQRARLQVGVAGAASGLEVVLEGPDGELARASRIASSGRVLVPLEFEAPGAGFLHLSARVQAAGDATEANNVIERTFAIESPFRVLYLGERMRGGERELAQLLGRGFEVSAARAEDALAEADVLVIDDLPAKALAASLQQDVARRVADGGLGLLMAGGEAAFGPGGYQDAPLAEILPIEFRQQEERQDPSTTLVVIIDTSGSMGGTRVQLAKEVARLAIRRLLPHDKVGIVEFYGAKRWAAPIQPASNSIDIQRALNRLDAGGGTVIMPALEEAYYGLLNVETRFKHVLVLTDGGVESGDFETLGRKMAEKGITLSTVLVGPEAHSEFLVSLAQWGKGRFYSVPDRFNLPEVLFKRPTSTRLPAYRRGEFRVRARAGPAWLGDARVAEAPPLLGLVEASARDGARTLLEDESGRPLFVSWHYGLGRVSAFLTEPTGPGTERWREWQGYGPLLAQALRRTLGAPRPPFRFQAERSDHVVTISAERLDASEDLPAARVLAAAPGSEAAEVSFRERAPGVFVATLRADPAQEVRLEARAVSPGGARERLLARLVLAAWSDRQDEAQVDPERRLDLAELAAATGGSVVSGNGEPLALAPSRSEARALLELAPFLFALALLAYLLDIVNRRLPRRARGTEAD